MQFPQINFMQQQYSLPEKLAQINLMLQSNYSAIARLQSRINSLMEINEKIKKELEGEETKTLKSTPLIENTAPEEKIIQKIFLKKSYNYYLILTSPLKMPLFKDRNFNVQIGLFDKNHKPVVNKNNIPLQISIYSCNDKPEMIDYNKQGNPIFKGNTSVDLSQGAATFCKLSIREVTSKYEKGLANIIVYVKSPPFDKDDEIDYRQIRPLVIKDVLIRAKKV